ncbi:hypothetical protein ACFSLT_27635 [Novosphingobium resinovorum]
MLIDDVSAIVEELLTFMALHDICAVGVEDLDQAMVMLERHASIRVLACDVRLGASPDCRSYRVFVRMPS